MEKLSFFYNRMKLQKIMRLAQRIDKLSKNMNKLSSNELLIKTAELRKKANEIEKLDSILEEAFAVFIEATIRVLHKRYFNVQIVGAILIHQGNIVEMKTGEGKTLAIALAAYFNALFNKGVFIVTSNEYLAKRDKDNVGRIFELLGISVGLLKSNMDIKSKKDAYMKDITYGTINQFGFDYLRDNITKNKEFVVQNRKDFIIIDEVDSILLDNAMMPLILTKDKIEDEVQNYIKVDKFVKSLNVDEDYKRNEDSIILTEQGIEKAEKLFRVKNLYMKKNLNLIHRINKSLYANYIMEINKNYIIKDSKIVLISKTTGRATPRRRLKDGLHEAIEAKENLYVNCESEIIASITIEEYFKLFRKVSGVTGTAIEAEMQFNSIYNMNVYQVPTNKNIIRRDLNDKLFKSKENKIDYIINEIKSKHLKGQPVLVGTQYVYEAEEISDRLKEEGIEHNILTAKEYENEAKIIAKAGEKKSITVATNIAGRGTDIVISEEVEKLGGLFVLGSSRNFYRRIDNQFIGRAGRQGQPGESLFCISIDDEFILKSYKSVYDDFKKHIEGLKVINGELICNRMTMKKLDNMQKKHEMKRLYERQANIKYNKVENLQRQKLYKERNKILFEDNTDKIIECIMMEIANLIYESNFLKFSKEVLKKLSIVTEICYQDEKVLDILKLKTKDEFIKEMLEVYSNEEKKNYIKEITLENFNKYWGLYLEDLSDSKRSMRFVKEGVQNKYQKRRNSEKFIEDMFLNFYNLKMNIYIDALKKIKTYSDIE